jgi:hypothetical protein
MPDEALLDAPEVDAIDDGAQVDDSSTQIDDSTSTDDGAQNADQTQTQDDTAPVISDANGQLKLSEKARAELDRIKAENPRLAREMRAALFDRQTLLARVPGGVKEALATIEAYEAEGGSEAVQAVKAENKLWQDLDADFQAGEPKFVEDIAKGNPEAFAKIAPTVMGKFAEIAPDAFSHEVSKVIAQDMIQAEIPFALKLFRREIEDPQNPGKTKSGMESIAEIYNSLQAYADRITKLAKTAPKTESKPADVPRGTSDIDQREQALTIQEFGAERARALDIVTEAEFKKNIGGRKASETQISAIRELYETRLDKMLRSDKAHTSKVDRFLAAKDKSGYAKHMAAAYRAKGPLAMEQAFKAVMPGKPGPVAVKPAAKPVAGAAKAATVTTGFTRTATKPDKNQVDWPRTNASRRTKEDENKYVMRDGSKVLYSR